MSSPRELVCRDPGPNPQLDVRITAPEQVRSGQVLVRVLATSVNPIDVKRSHGYGRRLLALMGAAGHERVLGNDFAGRVEAVGKHVKGLYVGQLVFGVLPTGRRGAHRTQVSVSENLVRAVPAGISPIQACVLPYTFCTLWQAMRSLKLNERTAPGMRVLVHGGGGALGQLCIHLLSGWGARVTAVASGRHAKRCRALGAQEVVDRHQQSLESLPADFDVTLNFGAWEDDAALVRRLGPRALGHATTVHPVLGALDERGWLKGAWHLLTAWRRMQGLMRERAPLARYSWTIFKPDPRALDVLADLMAKGRIQLEVGVVLPFTKAPEAFDHVAQGQPTRAVLEPQG